MMRIFFITSFFLLPQITWAADVPSDPDTGLSESMAETESGHDSGSGAGCRKFCHDDQSSIPGISQLLHSGEVHAPSIHSVMVDSILHDHTPTHHALDDVSRLLARISSTSNFGSILSDIQAAIELDPANISYITRCFLTPCIANTSDEHFIATLGRMAGDYDPSTHAGLTQILLARITNTSDERQIPGIAKLAVELDPTTNIQAAQSLLTRIANVKDERQIPGIAKLAVELDPTINLK